MPDPSSWNSKKSHIWLIFSEKFLICLHFNQSKVIFLQFDEIFRRKEEKFGKSLFTFWSRFLALFSLSQFWILNFSVSILASKWADIFEKNEVLEIFLPLANCRLLKYSKSRQTGFNRRKILGKSWQIHRIFGQCSNHHRRFTQSWPSWWPF